MAQNLIAINLHFQIRVKNMNKFTSAKCPNCGGAVKLLQDSNKGFCPYCNTDIVIEEQSDMVVGGEVTGNVENLLKLADEIFEMEHFEEALGYYNKALEHDVKQSRAWLGRGRAQGWLSNPLNFRHEEMFKSFDKAIAIAPESDRNSIQKTAFSYIMEIIAHLTGDDYLKGKSYHQSRELISFALETIVSVVREYPEDVELLKVAIIYCDKVFRNNEQFINIYDGVSAFGNYISKKKTFFKNMLTELDPTMKDFRDDKTETYFLDSNVCIVIYISLVFLFILFVILLSSC